MITRWTATWSRLRRTLSPTEWFVRWFRLPPTTTAAQERGLLLVQIDGLSRGQLQRAMKEGRLPFLQSLLQREHYRLHAMYSGLPSSTPSVQGELFYGVRCAVPAFGFRDHKTGQMVRMFARDVASNVERRLARENDGLLAGGSAYCNIYSGGAQEVHFCASSLGWDDLLLGQPWKLTTFLAWHLWSLLRMLGLAFVEFFLALSGFVQGTLNGRESGQELMMIPARVVVVILLRELATLGALMDVARGVPIVQLNYLGYDEQAHRRGPRSQFAHWALRGIDRSIERLWRASHRSSRREYDVWIYSDHGQETTTPYEYISGRRLGEVVDEVVAARCGSAAPQVDRDGPEDTTSGDPRFTMRDSMRAHTSLGRARWLGVSRLVGLLFGEEERESMAASTGAQVAALGPLGLIYANRDVSLDARRDIARSLVHEFNVPAAFVSSDVGTLAVTSRGEYDLATSADAVFGSDHPYLQDVASDLDQLCRHPNAGDLVVSGWVAGQAPFSFATQNGAHAGPGAEETDAFALVPCDVHMASTSRPYLRPSDLRNAVIEFFDGAQREPITNVTSSPDQAARVRVLTYNVHACIGLDGQLAPARIARVIAQTQVDIVSLQELDWFRARTGHRDQALELAHYLSMECEFHPVWEIAEERYGDAILSRWPMRLIRKGQLPSANPQREPRGVIWVEIELPGGRLQVLNTHLSIYPGERRLQAKAIAQDWISAARERGTTVMCGDLNAQPNSPTYRHFEDLLVDSQTFDASVPPAPTWFSPRPITRIDHIFVTEDLDVHSTEVIHSRLARVASDHLPLVAELAWANTSRTGKFRSDRIHYPPLQPTPARS